MKQKTFIAKDLIVEVPGSTIPHLETEVVFHVR